MIIFGSRTSRKFCGFLVDTCGYCRRLAVLGVLAQQTRFTLYFVPLFTTSSTVIAVCGNCQRERQILLGPQSQERLYDDQWSALAELESRTLGPGPQRQLGASTEAAGPDEPTEQYGEWVVVSSDWSGLPPRTVVTMARDEYGLVLISPSGPVSFAGSAVWPSPWEDASRLLDAVLNIETPQGYALALESRSGQSPDAVYDALIRPRG